jgi:molybdopterin synthase sulfur carrier subunit
LKIELFGQLTDIAGSNTITVEASDTEALVQAVNKQYPAMAGIKYIVAVDKKNIQVNTVINEASNIALLPPFSGG